jgi:hypothetical protein
MKYVLLICDDESVSPSNEDLLADPVHQKWLADLERRNARLFGARLRPVATATTVRVRGGETRSTHGAAAGPDQEPTDFYVVDCRDLDDAIAISNSVEYGLSSSIYTRDVNAAFRAMRDLDTGITYINAGTTGAEVHLPFGGTKATGNGHREAGQAALDTYTEWKAVYVDYSGRLQRAQIDNQEHPGP